MTTCAGGSRSGSRSRRAGCRSNRPAVHCPGDSTAVEVRVDATNLTAGDYVGAVELACNDPLRRGGVVPFRLHVGVRAVDFAIDPSLSADSHGRCSMGEIELPVGTDPRSVVTSSVLVQREIPVAPESLGCGGDPYPPTTATMTG